MSRPDVTSEFAFSRRLVGTMRSRHRGENPHTRERTELWQVQGNCQHREGRCYIQTEHRSNQSSRAPSRWKYHWADVSVPGHHAVIQPPEPTGKSPLLSQITKRGAG